MPKCSCSKSDNYFCGGNFCASGRVLDSDTTPPDSTEGKVKMFNQFYEEQPFNYDLHHKWSLALAEMLNSHALLLAQHEQTIGELRGRIEKMETGECCHLKCEMCDKADCTVGIHTDMDNRVLCENCIYNINNK